MYPLLSITCPLTANNVTSVVFLLGHGGSHQKEIDKESDEFQDIIQIDSFYENYHNLSLKTGYTLKFFNDDSKPESIRTSRYIVLSCFLWTFRPLYW